MYILKKKKFLNKKIDRLEYMLKGNVCFYDRLSDEREEYI
jgi:hypothetical protein